MNDLLSSQYVRRTCLDANTLWSATFVGSEIHFFCAGSDGYTFSVLVRGRKFQGAKVPSMVLSLLGAKVRGNESSIIH